MDPAVVDVVDKQLARLGVGQGGCKADLHTRSNLWAENDNACSTATHVSCVSRAQQQLVGLGVRQSGCQPSLAPASNLSAAKGRVCLGTVGFWGLQAVTKLCHRECSELHMTDDVNVIVQDKPAPGNSIPRLLQCLSKSLSQDALPCRCFAAGPSSGAVSSS